MENYISLEKTSTIYCDEEHSRTLEAESKKTFQHTQSSKVAHPNNISSLANLIDLNQINTLNVNII